MVKSGVPHSSAYAHFFHSYIGLKQWDPCALIVFMLFINGIVQKIKANSNDIFSVGDMQLFLLLHCGDAEVFAKSPEVLRYQMYTMGLEN